MAHEKKVESLKDLFDVAANARELITQRTTGSAALWFRGQPESKELTPRVYRKTKRDEGYWHDDEASMMATFMGQAPVRQAHCPSGRDWGRWLALMQHYGLPTRLLDWTCSILVAAFFATESVGGEATPEPDGMIWALNALALNEETLREGMIPTLDIPPIWRSQDLDSLDPSERMLPSLIYGAFDSDIDHPGVAAVAPPYIDLRMMIQQSRFTLHGRAPSGDGMALTDDQGHALEAYASLLRRFTISGAAKPKLRQALAEVGIRRSTLFPTLDHLASDLAADFVYPKRSDT